MKQKIKDIIKESISVKEMTLRTQLETIVRITKVFLDCLKNNGKVILFGNGGSASDSQHIAAELVVRFKKNRQSLPAIALTANSSVITAIGNDFGFDLIFSKQLESLAKRNDLVIAISTSGNSTNVIKAVELAKRMKLKTISFTGCGGGRLARLTDFSLIVPSNNTARIQEVHIAIAHAICEIIEESLFKK